MKLAKEVKLTRRQILVAAAAGSAIAANAQTPAQPPAATPGQSAADKVRQNADALEKFTIPMAVEPAFQFKA